MSKIAEKIFEQDGKVIVQQTHDFQPILDRAAALRSGEKTDFGESRRIGLVPMKLWAQWAKEAGISPGDPAMREVIDRKMMDGDFSALRVWEGTY